MQPPWRASGFTSPPTRQSNVDQQHIERQFEATRTRLVDQPLTDDIYP